MPLYTRLGDSGETMLYGGERLSKAEARVHAYGTLDELDALLGVVISHEECRDDLKVRMKELQKKLFIAKSDFATPMSFEGEAVRISQEDVDNLEKEIDVLEAKVPKLTKFITPGGSKVAALLHHARTVCRRAERWSVRFSEGSEINYAALRYLNRLGDMFFALGRAVNKEEGVEEVEAG
jgi:cob(I)alamin adenosyltransferase